MLYMELSFSSILKSLYVSLPQVSVEKTDSTNQRLSIVNTSLFHNQLQNHDTISVLGRKSIVAFFPQPTLNLACIFQFLIKDYEFTILSVGIHKQASQG